MMKKVFFIALLPVITVAHAANGINYIQYSKNAIPNIITATGIVSEIIFEEDEKIESANFGFNSAWDIEVVKDHILLFKAKDENPETNLLVHTNKRNYTFTVTTGNNNWKKNPSHAGATYSTRMIYHDDKSIAALKAKRAKSQKTILRHTNINTSDTYLFSNYDYRATNNATNLIPYRMWDNGKITFIAFQNGTKRGVVYELDEKNKPSLINQHTEKNGLLVLHGVYQKMIIRLGDQAVEVRRNTIGGQQENPNKTNVYATQRITNDDAPTAFKKAKITPSKPLLPVTLSTEESADEQNNEQ